jgi:O-antigen ligase
VILSKLQDKEDLTAGLSAIDILAGLGVITLILYTLYDSLFTRKLSLYHPTLLLILFASFWGVAVGFIYMITSYTTLNFLFREYSIFWSLVAVPLLFREATKTNPTFERNLFCMLAIAWFLVQLIAIVRVKSAFIAATYLYQSGGSRVAVLSTVLMLFILFALSATSERKGYQKWFFGGIVFTVIGIVCTFERTVWVVLVVLIPIMLIWSPKEQRIRATKQLISVIVFFIIVGLMAYLLVPLVGIILKFWLAKFTSSSHLTTDLSIVNRYIEWREALKQVVKTPILGLGFGGRYMSYTWFVGRTYLGGYVHNSYIGLILKLGIPGLIAVVISYFWLLFLGIKLSYSKILSVRERLFLRAGIAVLLLCIVRFMVANLFNERADLAYIGLIWGYFIVKYEKVRSIKQQKKETDVMQIEGQ